MAFYSPQTLSYAQPFSKSAVSVAFQPSIATFNRFANQYFDAGPVLQMGLRVVRKIITTVEEVKSNKEECADFIRRALEIYDYLAQAARAAGCSILPGSSAALRNLIDFKDEIERFSKLEKWRRVGKRAAIKSALEKRTAELDRNLLSLTAISAWTNRIRSDHQIFLASTAVSSTTASDSDAFDTRFDEPDVIQAEQPADVLPQIQDTQSDTSSESQFISDSVRQHLEQVSTSVKEVIRKNSLLSTDDQASTVDVQESRLQTPFTSEEQKKLEESRQEMERLFLPGDSEDLEGIFYVQSAVTAEHDDPANSASKLLADLCNGSNATLEKSTLISLRKLSDHLRILGLLDDVLTVDQVLAALCRRKVINGQALDQSNLASALRHLGASLCSVGRMDEALDATYEGHRIVETMASDP
ncbi:hypothetical protein CF326_g9157 [Tilletia indica]|nr:hypothetical protein CF326_g9157 [Tilletia indica]